MLQSLTIPTGERVSIGWVEAGGAGWDGAQSLPRIVTLDEHGLVYSPLPALTALHESYHFARHHAIEAGATEALPEISAFGGVIATACKRIFLTGLRCSHRVA